MLDVRATLHDAIVSAGMSVLGAMLEEERARLACGPQIRTPAGSEGDSIRTCGRRARGGGSEDACASAARSERRRREEVTLETWERFSAADPLTPRAVEQMVLGVSTRKYIRSIEPAPARLQNAGHKQELPV